MAIMSEVKGVDPKSTDYPKIMTTERGTIVLMVGRCRGVVLKNAKGGDYIIGSYHADWTMDCFTDFEGSVVVGNQ